jgi:hypothetical protein
MTEANLDTGHMQTYFVTRTPHPSGGTFVTPQEGSGYESSMNVREGRATALVHKRSEMQGELAGSEIVFAQYQAMASFSGVAPAPLRTLERHNVTSRSGEPVINYIHGRTDRRGETREFTAADNEFFALLGTENLSSAVFLVRQRGPALGISGIDRITLRGGSIIVHFRAA